jgi:hypothetical protein
MGAQGHDEDHGLCRGVRLIEDRAFCGTEGLATLRADEAPVLARMDANIGLAALASGWTRPIRQNVVVGAMIVLRVSLGNVPRGICLPPFALQVQLTTVKWGATHRVRLDLFL